VTSQKNISQLMIRERSIQLLAQVDLLPARRQLPTVERTYATPAPRFSSRTCDGLKMPEFDAKGSDATEGLRPTTRAQLIQIPRSQPAMTA